MNSYPKANLRLHVIIVGGGIAGLSTAYCLGRSGHRVTLVEQNVFPEASGAGIQLSPNVSRLLVRWGLKDKLDAEGVKPAGALFNRYSSDEEIGYNIIGDYFASMYGAPYYHVHRADLLQMLYDLAKAYTLFIKAKVVGMNPASGLTTVALESGELITGDLVIGADGIKSITRECILRRVDDILPTGDIAYRTTIPVGKLKDHPALSSLLSEPKTTCWMGPGRHIVGYFVRKKEVYNLVMIAPGTDADESWTAQTTRHEVAQIFRGWNQRVTTLIDLIENVQKWKLFLRPPLKTWIHECGRITLVGDSCHAMLPYLAQGAAMAIEDAAVLGRLFSAVTIHSDIPHLLKAYEALRHGRVSRTQEASYANRGRFHMPDGPEQQARDDTMRAARLDTIHKQMFPTEDVNLSVALGHSNSLAHSQFGYDAEAEADMWLKDHNYKPGREACYKL